MFGDKHWAEPRKWNASAAAAGQRARVFCASMADVFEEHPALPDQRERLWTLIDETPWLDWLLLTKRPQHIRRMIPAIWLEQPRPNVWFGTSVEDQAAADERIWHLLMVPAVRRFLSCEPLLGPLSLSRFFREDRQRRGNGIYWHSAGLVDWVIVGGESGAKARPMDADWVRSLRDQCQDAGVAFFFKQWGGRKGKRGGAEALLDDRMWHEVPRAVAR